MANSFALRWTSKAESALKKVSILLSLSCVKNAGRIDRHFFTMGCAGASRNNRDHRLPLVRASESARELGRSKFLDAIGILDISCSRIFALSFQTEGTS